jgi:phospholipid/cholesterol/gamma-HCH transport system substrate-binding protein
VRKSTVIGRAAAVAAVVLAIVAVAVIVMSGGSSYQVTAVFQNASQIVSGDQVEVGGVSIGTVSSISLTPNGLAKLQLSISNSSYAPLRKGTTAVVRESSLSSIANRYVDLTLAPNSAGSIPDGGVIATQDTSSEVDLDELFNTFNAPTRKALQNLFQGSASQYKGEAAKAQVAFQYLNPAIASSSMLFSEIDRNTAKFSDFLTRTAGLVSNIATRQSDLSSLIQNLGETTNALANQHVNLGLSIQRLPGFMTLADRTFTNLRTALTDLTPLVNDSKPVAPKLQKLLVQLKPLARTTT